MRTAAILATLVAAGPLIADDLAARAAEVLRTNCHRCHGAHGMREGGLGDILDVELLRDQSLVVPGRAAGSKLLTRVTKGAMPPADESPRPSPADVAVLAEWIAAGAKPFPGTVPAVVPPSTTELNALVLRDLERLDRRARRFQRYFTLAHLARAGLADDALHQHRVGLAKLLNSLSWHPKIAAPHRVDSAGLILRFDLRDLLWDANTWNRVLTEYLYGLVEETGAFRAVAAATGTRTPVVRADWFLATASRPPLYHDLLQLPTTAGELERQLRIDAALDIRQERVARAGFNGSGVSKNNRLIERRDAPHGAYWRTYDFEAVPQNLAERTNLAPDRRNLFAYPLGPGNTAESFRHAGGELIWHLPNGLLGFMLVDANDRRVDRAPTAIVSDPRRPDRAVEPGLSCLSCHVTGILPKSDQVRDHVARNPSAYAKADAVLVRALYPSESRMKKLMDEDAERFRRASEACGYRAGDADPVSAAALRYEADVTPRVAAAEVGLDVEEFRKRVATASLGQDIGALRGAGGVVSRAVYQRSFGDIARALKLGTIAQASLTDATDADPLEGPADRTHAAAVTPDGRFALLAAADRSLRLVEVATGREVRRFVGHATSVHSVAVSPDGRSALSGSLDGAVRLWDVATAQETRRFDGHDGLVSAVAFAPDGRRALSAGFDHAVIAWDVETGRELRRIERLASVVHSAAFLPDGRHVLAGGDPVAWLFDLDTGLVAQRFTGHAAAVVAVAASADGKSVLTGSDDGSARRWDAATGRELRRFDGGPAVAFANGEPRVGGTGVVALAPTSNGRGLIAVARDSSVRASAATAVTDDGAPRAGGLRQVASVALAGTLSAPVLSPNGRWLYVLNRTDGRLLRVDAATLKTTAARAVPDGAAFALARDGKAVTVVAPAADEREPGVLLTLDPSTLEVRHTLPLPFEPFDVAVGTGDRVFVSGGGRGWSEVRTYERGAEVERRGGVWAKSLLAATPDGTRLLAATTGVSPARVEIVGGAQAAASGPATLTPDGRLAVCASGPVLQLDNGLKSVADIGPMLACAATTGSLIAFRDDGSVRAFGTGDWKLGWEAKIGVVAYGAAVDPAAGLLYVTGIPTAALRDRQRARAVGDVVVYRLTP